MMSIGKSTCKNKNKIDNDPSNGDENSRKEENRKETREYEQHNHENTTSCFSHIETMNTNQTENET